MGINELLIENLKKILYNYYRKDEKGVIPAMIDKYLEQDAIAVHSYEDAVAIQKTLIENGYCVMISREENLWLINWVWTERFADRNDVIFINRSCYECDWDNFLDAHPELQLREEG